MNCAFPSSVLGNFAADILTDIPIHINKTFIDGFKYFGLCFFDYRDDFCEAGG